MHNRELGDVISKITSDQLRFSPSDRCNKRVKSWPKMTDIINILIRCKFACRVEFGFICELAKL